MADDIIDLDEIYAKATEAAENFGTKAQEAGAKAKDSISGVSDKISSMSDALKNSSSSLTNMLNVEVSAANLTRAYSNLRDMAVDYNLSSNGALMETASIATNFLIPGLTSGVKMFGEFGDSGIDAGQKISGSLDKLAPIFNTILGKNIGSFFLGGAEEAFRLSEEARGSETALFKLLSTSGSLNSTLKDGVSVTQQLDDINAGFSERLNDVGNTTGRVSSSLIPYLRNLEQIPNALDTFVTGVDGSGKSLDLFSASIKLADGLGLKHSETMDYISNVHNKFGTSIESSMNQLAAFRARAQELEMPLDIMNKYISGATSGISSMGDASDSAIKLLGSLGSVLRDTGASRQAIADISAGMISGAKDMDIGQAAFINQTSGGRGGLAGGFEIELLKQQGNFAEIINRTMQSMEKIGVGSPVTLQNVQDNPALAGQLLQQRELIKQFGLAGNDQDAYRVLEAMQSGGSDALAKAISDIKDPQLATIEAIQRGNELIAGGNNTAIRVANAVELTQRLLSQNTRSGLERIDNTLGGNEIQENVVSQTVTGNIVYGTERPGEMDRTQGQITNRQAIASDIGTSVYDFGRDFAAGMKDVFSTLKEEVGGIKIGESLNGILSGINEKLNTTQSQEVKLNGDINVTVDLKDNMKVVAKEVFAEEIVNFQKGKEKQIFTGSK